MRLGVIEFGTPLAETPALSSALGAHGVDVITKLADPPPTSPRDEAERLHRAECDGVLVTIGDGVVPDDVAEAMLFLHCPLMVASDAGAGGSDPILVTEANAIIAALGVAVDVREPRKLSMESVETWLRENARINRQKGIEAAHKLYGTRILANAAADIGSFALKMRWLQQFGVLARSDDGGNLRPDDLIVADGSILGALTQRILCLVSGLPEAITIPRSQLRSAVLEPDQIVLTIALISTSRASGSESELSRNFYGRIFRGVEIGEGAYAVGPNALAFLDADGDPQATEFYAIPGDFVGSVRAALNTLDVPTVVLRAN